MPVDSPKHSHSLMLFVTQNMTHFDPVDLFINSTSFFSRHVYYVHSCTTHDHLLSVRGVCMGVSYSGIQTRGWGSGQGM